MGKYNMTVTFEFTTEVDEISSAKKELVKRLQLCAGHTNGTMAGVTDLLELVSVHYRRKD